MVTSTTDIRDELKKRLGVTGEFIGKDNRRYWLTDRCQCIDPNLAGAPMPTLLVAIMSKSKTLDEMIYLIQVGLGVYDDAGNRLPYEAPKPKTYQSYRDALNWLESNYPGGWFYAVDKIWKTARENQRTTIKN